MRGQPKQLISPEREMDTLDVAVKKGREFLISLMNTNLISGIIIGDTKEKSVIEEKAQRKYDGDQSYVTDKGRMTGLLDHPKQFEEICNILNNNHIMRDHGMLVVSESDYITRPRKHSDARGLHIKPAFYTGKNPDSGASEFNIIEIQFRPKQGQPFYNMTHDHLRAGQNIRNIPKQERTEQQQELKSGHYAFCRYCNGLYAREFGYDELLDKDSYSLTGNKQTRLESQLLKFNDLIEELGTQYEDGMFRGRPMILRAQQTLEKAQEEFPISKNHLAME